jgi:hypothetical protein
MITERMLDECLGCEGWRQKAEFFASERLGRDLFVAAWTGVLLTSSTSAAGANSLSGQTRVSRTITEQSTVFDSMKSARPLRRGAEINRSVRRCFVRRDISVFADATLGSYS